MDTTAIAVQHRPHLRHWHDLSKRRLFFSLAFAPVLPIALGSLIVIIVSGELFIRPAPMWSALGITLAAAETWSMLIGTLFLIVARRSGGVRRAHCILLGAFLAFSLPSAAFVTSKTVNWVYSETAETPADDFNEFHGPSDEAFLLIFGVALIPFGTLGGWVFWRGGVYPARPQVHDVAPVFD